jgi:hypothetical protein
VKEGAFERRAGDLVMARRLVPYILSRGIVEARKLVDQRKYVCIRIIYLDWGAQSLYTARRGCARFKYKQ